jgi:hypothetical protein
MIQIHKKQIIRCLFAVSVMLLSFAAAGIADRPRTARAASAPPAVGDGLSAETAYEIGTAAGLAWLAEAVNAGNTEYNDKYYKLADGIPEAGLDLSVYGAGYNSGKGWIPLGKWTDSLNMQPFSGVFDGNNKKLTGLYIHDLNSSYCGLFGYIDNAGTVKNLSVSGTVNGQRIVGGIAGNNRGRIENCSFSGTVSAVSYEAGGIAGDIGGGGTVINSRFSGAVSAGEQVGGIAGLAYGDITNCYSAADLSGGDRIGGIAGFVTGDIVNSYAAGSVEGLGKVGGIAAETNGCFIKNCYFTGTVKEKEDSRTLFAYAGGIAGHMTGGGIANCYVTGEVVNPNGKAGGIAGNTHGANIYSCAALNPAVKGTGENRILANNYNGAVSGNRAFGSMANDLNTTQWEIGSYNGTDMTVENAVTAAFWTARSNWYDSAAYAWDEAVWSFTDGKLPVLRYAGGEQTGAPPPHLTVRSVENAAVTVTPEFITYTGGVIPFELTAAIDGVTLTRGKDYDFEVTSGDGAGTSAGINAGIVTVTVTGAVNFTGSKAAAFEIGKRPLTPADFDYTVPLYHVYDGFRQGIGAVTGLPELGTIIVKYNGDTAFPVDAGSYGVTAELAAGGGNYGADAVFLGEYIISKAVPIAPTELTAVYGDKLSDVALSAGWSWAEPGAFVGGAGGNTHKAGYTPSDTVNYAAVTSVDLTVTVEKAAGAASSAPVLNSTSGGNITIDPVAAPANGQVTEYAISAANEAPASGWQESTDFNGLTLRNTYYIFARSKENENFKAGEISAVLEVELERDTGCERESGAAGLVLGSAALFFAFRKIFVRN